MSNHTQLPSGTTAPLTTFHPFPKLPWELRHEIWELAVRPLDRPGVHIFCVEERELDDSEAKECDVVCGHIPLDPGKSNLHIAVPATTISAGSTGNPSTYMIDGGLWTACKESRAVMENAFKHQMWDPKRRAYPAYYWSSFRRFGFILPRALRSPSPVAENPFEGLEDETDMIPATGFFLSAPSASSSSSAQATKADQPNGQVRISAHYFTVFPHWDLFIIRPSSWNMGHHFWSELECSFPFGSKKWGFFGFGGDHGLAFEYKPVWIEGSEATHDGYGENLGGLLGVIGIVDRIISATGQLKTNGGGTIWLIDYRLKLKQDTPADKREPDGNQKVFYGNDGRRYVEMYSKFVEGGGDRLQWFYTEGVDGVNSAIGKQSCHSFIEDVGTSIMDILNENAEGAWGDEARRVPKLGLLACLR